MRRLLTLAALVLAATSVSACQSSIFTRTSNANVAAASVMNRELASYHLVYSEYQGKVGYLKVYDVSEAGGQAYRWSYVYDLDFNERGYIDQLGNAFKYHNLPEAQSRSQDRQVRVDRMAADSLERNVMRLLEIDPSMDAVSFPEATEADILGG